MAKPPVKIDLSKWQAAIKRLDQRAIDGAKKALNVAGLAFAAEAKKHLLATNAGYQKGTLSRSIQPGPVAQKGKSFSVLIGTRILYARIQEFGGIIRPVVAKFLRFQVKGGAWVTTKKVTIPAKGYFAMARTKGQKYLKIVASILNQALKKK